MNNYLGAVMALFARASKQGKRVTSHLRASCKVCKATRLTFKGGSELDNARIKKA